MLLSNRYEVKLKKRYLKLIHLSCAFKETFVFLGMPQTGKDVFVHCDKQGKILYEFPFENNVDSFGMLSQSQVLVLDTRKNAIIAINLLNHSVMEYDHQFAFEQSDQSNIDTFSQTKLLCVRESGRYNDHRFKLSYYEYPLNKGAKPVAFFESTDNIWTYEHITTKGNNHSMIIWYKGRQDQEFSFNTFDLRDDPKGKFNVITLKNTIGQSYNLNKVQCALINIWQNKKGVFCLVTISNKTQQKAFNAQGVVNNNFILDVNANTIRQTKFWFQPQYNDYQIDIYNLGSISMFRTCFFENGAVRRTPVYYVNNQIQQIVAYDSWQCTYKTKYFIPGFDTSMIVESQYENGDVDEFVLYIKKVMDPKQIALHFLLHINEDFDDDLLKDAIQLLESND